MRLIIQNLLLLLKLRSKRRRKIDFLIAQNDRYLRDVERMMEEVRRWDYRPARRTR